MRKLAEPIRFVLPLRVHSLVAFLLVWMWLGVGVAQAKWYDTYDFAAKGVVAYWPFDGDASDKTSNGNNGTWNGGGFASGVLGQGYGFSSHTSYTVPGPAGRGIHAFSAFTLAAWFKMTSDPGDNESLLGAGLDGQPAHAFLFILNSFGGSSTRKAFGLNAATDSNAELTTPAVEIPNPIGQWHHLAVTWDGTTAKAYLDGVLASSRAPVSGTVTIPISESFLINAHHWASGTSARLAGVVDEVVVAQRALSEAEIAALATDSDADGIADLWTGVNALKADFLWAPATPAAQQAVQFTDRSTGSPTSWLWEFGDGASATAQNPTHIYASAGTYSVFLLACRGATCDAKTQTLTVGPSANVIPVVFVHGFCGDAIQTWTSMVQNLKGINPARYPGSLVNVYFDGQTVRSRTAGQGLGGNHLFTISLYNRFAPAGRGFDPTQVNDVPIEEHALQLRRVVEAISQANGGSPVDIVGHSMGGLVARAYVEGMAQAHGGTPQAYNGRPVRRIITIDTPHLGSPFANWVNKLDIKCLAESSTDRNELVQNGSFIQAVNDRAIPSSVTITAIASRRTNGSDDNIVPFESQLWFPLVANYACAPNVEGIRNLLDSAPIGVLQVLLNDLFQTAQWVDTRLSTAPSSRRINLVPIAGDWDGDGKAGIGLFDPLTHQFWLKNNIVPGPADATLSLSGGSSACPQPVVGDWNGDRRDAPGIYDQVSRRFQLTGSQVTNYGPSGPLGEVPEAFGWIALAGDWDGNGTDTVGFFDPVTARVYYRNNFSGNNEFFGDFRWQSVVTHMEQWRAVVGRWELSGRAQQVSIYKPNQGIFEFYPRIGPLVQIRFGPINSELLPIAGDWNGDGITDIGLYDPVNSIFTLRWVQNGSPVIVELPFSRP